MKKLVILTMVVALFIGIPVCVFAQSDQLEPRDASKLCKQCAADFSDGFAASFKNLGDCVSSIKACGEYGNTPEWCICRQLRFADPDGYEAAYATQGLGPCIADYRARR